ncbi:MAG: agmatinase [Candidatus Micrarchaeota archaeon]
MDNHYRSCGFRDGIAMTKKVPFNFGGLPKEYASYGKAKIVVLPLPFDKTSTWGKGADKGPKAIIEASRNMELYDIETATEVYEQGIFTDKPLNAATAEKLAAVSHAKVKSLLADDKFVVCLGGEHSISAGPLKAHVERYPDMSVLHLDAHSDRRDSYLGSKYNHACIMARAQDMCKTCVSVGIRSMDSTELQRARRDRIFYAHELTADWIPRVVASLTKDVYITIDLDVFDPGVMPSTGTPEPGGLSWQQVNSLMNAVSKSKNIVGLDVVELAPGKFNKAPDFLAAKLIYRILSQKFSRGF